MMRLNLFVLSVLNFLIGFFPKSIFDQTLLMSDQQAITGTANSTNYIDLGTPGTPYGGAAAFNRDIGKGTRIPLLVQVTEDFNTLTSLDIILQTDDDSAFGSAKTVFSKNVVLADLLAGYQVPFDYVPKTVDERYFRMRYVVNGSNPSTGKITAGIVMGIGNNTTGV